MVNDQSCDRDPLSKDHSLLGEEGLTSVSSISPETFVDEFRNSLSACEKKQRNREAAKTASLKGKCLLNKRESVSEAN